VFFPSSQSAPRVAQPFWPSNRTGRDAPGRCGLLARQYGSAVSSGFWFDLTTVLPALVLHLRGIVDSSFRLCATQDKQRKLAGKGGHPTRERGGPLGTGMRFLLAALREAAGGFRKPVKTHVLGENAADRCAGSPFSRHATTQPAGWWGEGGEVRPVSKRRRLSHVLRMASGPTWPALRLSFCL